MFLNSLIWGKSCFCLYSIRFINKYFKKHFTVVIKITFTLFLHIYSLHVSLLTKKMPRLNSRLMLSSVGQPVKMNGVVFLEGKDICMAEMLRRRFYSSRIICEYGWLKLLHQNCFSTIN